MITKKIRVAVKIVLLGVGILSFVVSTAKGQTVSGTVTDANSEEALPGVNVLVKGTQFGTATGSDGAYELGVTSLNDTLVVSFVGYQTQEIPIDGRTTVNVALERGAITGEELVVVGFSTQQQESVTGAVEPIDGAELAEQPSVQTSSALMGRVSGVQVVQNSGQPGDDDGTVRIRGIGTIGNADPLVLIDGVEGSLDNIPSSNIESISVLKDAASAAIYGNRASNGVILVTTKRGQGAELRANYEGHVGVQSATRQPDFVGAGEYMRLNNLGKTNIGQDPVWSEDFIQSWEENTNGGANPTPEFPNTDWVESLFTESAIQTQHSLSLNGGGENTSYFGSVTYDEQSGEVPNFGFDRFNVRLNTDVNITDEIQLTIDGKFVDSEQTEPTAGTGLTIRQAYRTPPIFLDRFPNGNLGPGFSGRNAIAEAHDGGLTTTETNLFRGRMQLRYEPTQGLDLRVMYAPEYENIFNKSMRKQWESIDPETGEIISQFPARNSLTEGFQKTFTNNAVATATYQTEISNHSFLKILGGGEFVEEEFNFFNAFRDNFTLERLEVLNAGAQANQQNSGSATKFTLLSGFGRLNYEFQNKYLVEANVRYDGSSRFAEDVRWGVFPSFSAGWRISEEPFMESVDFIDQLKIRGSWGILGNQEVGGNFPFAAVVNFGQDFVFGGNTVGGAAQTELANEGLTWEETTTTDIGLDAALLDNRLTLTADWFKKTTDDILLQLPVPLVVGLDAPFQNAGVVENTGWETRVGYNDDIDVFGEEISYNFSFNISDVTNEVTDLAGAGPFISGNSIIKTGEPINSIYGWESDGLFDSQEEIDNHASQFGSVARGDIKYVDQNDDGVINEEDRVIVGNPFPDFNYGFEIGLEYKGFNVSAFLQGVGSRDVFLSGDAAWAFSNAGKIQNWQAESFWTPDNPDDDFPRLTATTSHNNFRTTDYWVYDAGYLRLRNLRVGYTLPATWTNKVNVRNLRIFFLGQNLWTGLDDMPPGMDPNVPNSTPGSFFPQQTLYSIGVSIGV